MTANQLHDDYVKVTGRTGERFRSTSTRLGIHLRKVFGQDAMQKKTNQLYTVPTGEVYSEGEQEGIPIFKDEYGTIYTLPELEDCREAFALYMKTNIDWPEEEEIPF